MAENNFNTQGGYFAPANYFKVEAGGSHNENPNGGVQIGVDPQGIPNMLEEGEPVYDDYVFSDNIKAEKDILSQYNLPTKYAGKLYSEIADAYVDEAEERPLDSISNNGLRSMLSRLADAQEEQKQKEQEKELEEELANMSPEELAELEAMLADEQDAETNVQEEMIGEPSKYKRGGFMNKFGEGDTMDRARKSDSTGEGHEIYPTWPRYVAPAMHGALALTNAFTPPTKFKYQRFIPQTVSGQINLNDMTYQPIPLDYLANQTLANSAGTIRALRESGLVNPASAIIAADRNIGQNLGNTLLSGWQANNAQRNQVVQFNNANRGTEADFNYRLALANAAARERAQMNNIQHDLYIQRLNDAAESEQYAAINNELGHAMESLSGIGTENFNMNMANSVYPYAIDKNGHVRYIKPSACGGLLKTYKK